MSSQDHAPVVLPGVRLCVTARPALPEASAGVIDLARAGEPQPGDESRPWHRVFRIPALVAPAGLPAWLDAPAPAPEPEPEPGARTQGHAQERPLLAVFDARPDLDDLPGPVDLVARGSRDGGRTWGPRRILREGRGIEGFGDPCAIVDGEQVHVLHCAGTRAGFFESAPGWDERSEEIQHIDSLSIGPDGARTIRRHTASLRSSLRTLLREHGEDEGADEASEGAAGLFVASGHGIRLGREPRAGRLLAAALARIGDALRVVVIASDDRSRSWQALAVLPPGGNEAVLAELEDGTLVLHARRPGCRIESRSGDGGATFTPWREVPALPDPGTNGDLLAMPAPGDRAGASTGTSEPEMLLVSHCADPEIRRRLMLIASADGGAHWDRRLVLEGEGASYSALADAGGGAVGALWEADGHRVLRFRRVETSQLRPLAEAGSEPEPEPEPSLDAPVPSRVGTQAETVGPRGTLVLRHVALAPLGERREGLRIASDAGAWSPAEFKIVAGQEQILVAREHLEEMLGPDRSDLRAGDELCVDGRAILPGGGGGGGGDGDGVGGGRGGGGIGAGAEVRLVVGEGRGRIAARWSADAAEIRIGPTAIRLQAGDFTARGDVTLRLDLAGEGR